MMPNRMFIINRVRKLFKNGNSTWAQTTVALKYSNNAMAMALRHRDFEAYELLKVMIPSAGILLSRRCSVLGSGRGNI